MTLVENLAAFQGLSTGVLAATHLSPVGRHDGFACFLHSSSETKCAVATKYNCVKKTESSDFISKTLKNVQGVSFRMVSFNCKANFCNETEKFRCLPSADFMCVVQQACIRDN